MANPEVQIDVALEVRAARKALDSLNSEFTEFANNAKKQSRKADVAFGSFIGNLGANATTKAFAAIKAGFRDAFQESLRFNRALREIETILPNDVKLTAQLVNQLDALGKQFGTGATQQAKAFYQIISAGVTDAAEAQQALNAANLLSTGGLSDLTSSIDVITDILNVYQDANISAGEAADTLFKSVQLGKLTVDSISGSIAQALPSARALGIGLEEVASALVVLTKNGFNANEAAVRLRALFGAVAKDGQKLGDGLNSSAIAANGLGGFLETLSERTQGSADATANLFANVRAQQAALILANNSAKDFTETLGEYETKAGAAARASEKIVGDDLSKQLEIATKGALAAARAIFDDLTPALLSVTKAFNQGLSPTINRTLPELQGKLRTLNIELAATSDATNRVALGFNRTAEEIQADIDAVSKKIFQLEGGQLNLIPSDAGLRIAEINEEIGKLQQSLLTGQASDPSSIFGKIDSLQLQIKAIKDEAKTISIGPDIAPTVGGGGNGAVQRNEAEAKSLIELNKLREQADLEEEEREIRRREAAGEQITGDLEALQDIEAQKLEIINEAELARAALLTDSRTRELEEQKANAKLALAQQKQQTKEEVAAAKARVELQRKLESGRVSIAQNAASLIAAVSKDGSKAAFLAQKAAAIASAIVAKEQAAALALASPPGPPATLPLAAQARIAGNISIAAIAASAIKGFQSGGFVNSSAKVGDKNLIRVNGDEAVLNTRQQREFMRVANGSGGSNDNQMVERIDALIGAIQSQNITVEVDGREIARVMRDEQRAQGVS